MPDVLLERAHELDVLRRAVGRAARGAGGIVLIEGGPGLGKSRLVEGARAAAREAGLLVLRARGAELEREFAFGVARQLFETALAGLGAAEREALLDGPAEAAAERLSDPGDGAGSATRAPGDTGAAMLHGLYRLTAALAERTPLLVAVDDAHWADDPSLRFLDYLARRIDELPALLVATGDSAEPAVRDGLWHRLAAEPAAETLRPRPLGPEAVRDLVRERLGADAAPEFCVACELATRGNPLFLRELLGALEEAGLAPTASAASEVPAVGPPAVARFVRARLLRLGPEATRLARAAAVCGDGTEPSVARRVADLDEAAAREAADGLVRADVLSPDARLGFVHPIVCAAIESDLVPGERLALHERAAAALAEAGAAPERVAAHLLRTSVTGEGARVPILRAAAAGAAARGAPAGAVEYLRRALAEPPAPGDLPAVLAELGRWEVAEQRFAAAEEHLRGAVEATADAAARAEAALWLGRCAVVSGRSAAAAADVLAELSAELAGTDPMRSLELELGLVTVTGSDPALRDRLPERLARFEEHAAGHPAYESAARVHAAHASVLRGEPAGPAAAATEAAIGAGLPRDDFTLYRALTTLRITERFETAGGLLDAGLRLARTEGRSTLLAAVHGQRAALALARGSVGDALTEAEAGLAAIDEHHVALPQLAAVAIDAHVERGEIEAAERAAERAAAAVEMEDRPFGDAFLVSRGRLRVAQGEMYAGLEDLLRCGARLHAHGIALLGDWRAFAAQALAAVGEADRAAALAEEQIALARGLGASGTLGRALRTGGTAIGGAEGLALLEEAVAVLGRSPARLEHAHALADLGAELARRRRRRESREVLRLAVHEATSCGATALAELVRGELGAGGGRPARLELTGVEALTPAERRVCVLAAAGDLTNRDIAQRLFVTEKTVELHLTSAYRKLGIRSRFQLAPALEPRP
jgi:DNA-binding CsgD family transcriptional regulator